MVAAYCFASKAPYSVACEFLQADFVHWGQSLHRPLDIFASGVFPPNVFLLFGHSPTRECRIYRDLGEIAKLSFRDAIARKTTPL